MKSKTIVDLISALFILLFVYTGFNKIITANTLSIVLVDYPLIGSMHHIVAWVLPITELVVAASLFYPQTRFIGLFASLGLMLAFTLYLAYMLIFTPDLPCTCGGMLQKMTWPQHLVFNLLFVGLSVLAIWLNRKAIAKEKTDSKKVVFT